MSRVRLLPIVIVAASGLLVLKATELVSRGGPVTAEPAAHPQKPLRAEDLPKFARALVRQRIPEPSDADFTGSVTAKKDDAKKDEAKKGEAKKDEAKPAEQRPPDLLPPTPTSASERAVLERLQERRGAMDERAKEMEMREALLQAAERKLDGRINDLKAIEERLDAGARAEKAEVDKQLRTVVVMYETMKPKDAARVFDRLKLDVLVPVATAMKPQRMAEILAAMSPEAAERLTVALATRGLEAQASAPAAAAAPTPAGELPRIDQSQARPRR
jgi:flagellar motility protein MotE (MotC chaperone)